jgi:hypothetical protein
MSTTTTTTLVAAAIYIASGICQPLLMTVCKNAGLADSHAQLYMLFYYAGPSCLLLTLLPCCYNSSSNSSSSIDENNSLLRPSVSTILKASLIACFDIAAQSLNYTGASLAGATIFAMVYSSVTVWTAIFSRVFLGRILTRQQFCAVLVVFAGLCMTGLDSFTLGVDVAHGTILIFLGSCMHGATYVMSEAIMAKHTSTTTACAPLPGDNDMTATVSKNKTTRDLLSVRENSAIQGVVACSGLLVWQLVYTASRWDLLIRQPMTAAGTTVVQAACILTAFGLANLLHSFSFYHTLAHYPGGSTSAGVMKGLQAVLVFVAAHVLYCSSTNRDMCFSTPKFLSLVTVVGGVVLFSASKDKASACSRGAGYTRIESVRADEATV